MNRVKLFYSYCHKDESYRDQLETHLAILKRNGHIEEWHDRKILGGSDWDEEIDKNMKSSNIILLLYSPEFIASNSCQKEVTRALELQKEMGTTVIPVILRTCSWLEINEIAKLQAFPIDGEAISNWHNQDQAWHDVFKGVKDRIIDIQKKNLPKLKQEIKNNLAKSDIGDGEITDVFVFPDLININKTDDLYLEKNELSSEKLKGVKNLKKNFYLIEGEEQCGKSSLGKVLFFEFIEKELLPILLNGEFIKGKPKVNDFINVIFKNLYDSQLNYHGYA